ncbi:hypothetical protein D3C85_1756470 [compost metagenome]
MALLTPSSALFALGRVLALNCTRPLRNSTRLLSRFSAIWSTGTLLNLSTMAWSFSCNCSRLPGTVGITTGRALASKTTLSALG